MREAKVEDSQLPIVRPHDVFRFQITMDDAARVRLGERAGDLPAVRMISAADRRRPDAISSRSVAPSMNSVTKNSSSSISSSA